LKHGQLQHEPVPEQGREANPVMLAAAIATSKSSDIRNQVNLHNLVAPRVPNIPMTMIGAKSMLYLNVEALKGNETAARA